MSVNILCVGAAVADFVYYLDALPTRPEKYGTERADIVGGGCAANAAVAVSRLGGRATLAARMGDDPMGDLILGDLKAEGVDVSNISRTQGGRSSYSSVAIDPSGERQIVNFRGSSLTFDTVWFERLTEVSAVLTDTRRVAAAIAAMQLARRLNVPGIVDGEAPIDPGILEEASHVALSMQGLRSLVPVGAIDDALVQLKSQFGGWFCVTDGANGVHYTHGGAVDHCPAFPVEAVDTLGAGDVWHGAFALALAEGQEAPDAIRFASAAAALKCTRLGGRAGTPTRSEVLEFMSGAL